MGLLTDLLGDGNATYYDSAADVIGGFTGTPDGTKFLKDDGTLATPAGGAASGATVATLETTTATAYTDLATVGPSVTVTVPASGVVLVSIGAQLFNGTAGGAARMSFAVSGANTVAASTAYAFGGNSSSADNQLLGSRVTLLTGLTPGSSTFTAKYESSGGTANFAARTLVVMPL